MSQSYKFLADKGKVQQVEEENSGNGTFVIWRLSGLSNIFSQNLSTHMLLFYMCNGIICRHLKRRGSLSVWWLFHSSSIHSSIPFILHTGHKRQGARKPHVFWKRCVNVPQTCWNVILRQQVPSFYGWNFIYFMAVFYNTHLCLSVPITDQSL